MIARNLVFLLICPLFSGCIETPNEFTAIPPGPWRATLDLSGKSGALDAAFDERTGGKLPFNFDVTYVNEDSFFIEVINGEERILVNHINFGLDRRTGKDTIRIMFPEFGSYVYAQYEEDAIEGDFFIPNRGEDYIIPFRALHGKTERFTRIDPPVTDISGEWTCMFEIGTDHPYPAIGTFKQEENGRVTGTFITETGDYRYLEGKMADNRLYLSAFDGSHVFMFEAKYLDDGTMTGIFRSGNHYKVYWEARRDTTIELKDPYTMTIMNDSTEPLSFAFPNASGDTISLTNARYVGKPKLVQIMGTWCPNCRDETAFLLEHKKANPDKDFEIISLAFERNTSVENALNAITKYKEYFDIDYEILYAGTSSKTEASETLPMLSGVLSYPTLLFVDRNDHVTKIHTGFNGPATDKYKAFTDQFERDLQEIIDSVPSI